MRNIRHHKSFRWIKQMKHFREHIRHLLGAVLLIAGLMVLFASGPAGAQNEPEGKPTLTVNPHIVSVPGEEYDFMITGEGFLGDMIVMSCDVVEGQGEINVADHCDTKNQISASPDDDGYFTEMVTYVVGDKGIWIATVDEEETVVSSVKVLTIAITASEAEDARAATIAAASEAQEAAERANAAASDAENAKVAAAQASEDAQQQKKIAETATEMAMKAAIEAATEGEGSSSVGTIAVVAIVVVIVVAGIVAIGGLFVLRKRQTETSSQHLEEIRRQLEVAHAALDDKVNSSLDKVNTALVVRDPGTSMSADAYEGLRRQVVAAASERRAHVAQLAQIDDALSRTEKVDALRDLSAEWLNAAGIVKLFDVSEEHARAFEIHGHGDGALIVDSPAYVVSETGQIARQGRASREAV